MVMKKKKAMAKGGYGTPTKKMNMNKPKMMGGGAMMKKKKAMAKGGAMGMKKKKAYARGGAAKRK
tara:strand:+ start:454 stop:648 length:195 start_codon:yes stop_codon:yes gene_type:complete